MDEDCCHKEGSDALSSWEGLGNLALESNERLFHQHTSDVATCEWRQKTVNSALRLTRRYN